MPNFASTCCAKSCSCDIVVLSCITITPSLIGVAFFCIRCPVVCSYCCLIICNLLAMLSDCQLSFVGESSARTYGKSLCRKLCASESPVTGLICMLVCCIFRLFFFSPGNGMPGTLNPLWVIVCYNLVAKLGILFGI